MITGEFTAEDWVERLARALAGVAETQKHYWDELDQQRQQRILSESDWLLGSAFDHPSHDLQRFYWRASGGGRYSAAHYGPLRTALAEVQRVLAVHPAWAGLVAPTDGKDKIWIQTVSHGSLGTLSNMIGGLVARGMEVPGDGFRVAAAELHGLLDPGGDREQVPVRGDLSVGYHVALFYGLRVSEEIRLAEEMTLLPFEQIDAFVDKHVLLDVVPELIGHSRQKPVGIGALVKPFRWKPEFRKRGYASDFDLDGSGSFFENVEAFVELLAMFHAAPVTCLAQIPYCIHPTASHLLGLPHYHGSYQWSRAARSFDKLTQSSEVNLDAINEAREAFRRRKSAQYQYCAPVITRLVEALARSGRFQSEDKILDVAIALERIYKPGQGEITFKLKAMAACFLETDMKGREEVFQDVGEFYRMRSKIVHGEKLSAEAKNETFTKGFEVARRSVVKLLQDGPPSAWHKVVIAGTEPSAPKP